MTVNTAGGAKIYIGPTATSTTDTQGEYEALSYVEVGEVEDLGQVGDEDADVAFTALNDSRVRHFKGPTDGGTIAVVAGDDTTDTGQAAMDAAFANKTEDYAFKLELADELTLAGTPTTLYFRGKVMSMRRNVGNVSNVVRKNYNVGVNSDFIEVQAA